MLGAAMMKHAALPAKVLLEFASIHVALAYPVRRESCLKSLTLACRRDLRASRAFSNASETVSASVINSGSSGEVTTNPPSSASVRLRTSFPSLTV